MEAVIESINEESNSVILKTGTKVVSEAVVRGTTVSHLALNQLSPGMRINATIDKLCNNGFTATFLGLFHGCVDELSMSAPSAPNEWELRYTKDNLVGARVVYVDHASKSVRLSLRPHVLAMRVPKPALPPLGSMLEDFTVCVPFKKTGVLAAKFPDEEEEEEVEADHGSGKKAAGSSKKLADELKKQALKDEKVLGVFIHRSQLSSSARADFRVEEEDDEGRGKNSKSKAASPSDASIIDPSKIEKVYKAGTHIGILRVLGYHLVEGLLFASNRADLLVGSAGSATVKAAGDIEIGNAGSDTTAVVHASSVVVGRNYEVTVQSVRDFGLVLQIGTSGNVQGVCPTIHLTDTSTASYDNKGKLKVPPPSSKLYKKGQKMTMRVWEKDGNSILLTHKKSLLAIPDRSESASGEEGLLSMYGEARVGEVATGVISKISVTDGLTVHFANKVKALVPMLMLVKQGVLDPLEAYRVGQIVKTVIISTKGVLGKAAKDINKGSRVFRLVAALNLGKASTTLQTAQSLGLCSGEENDSDMKRDILRAGSDYNEQESNSDEDREDAMDADEGDVREGADEAPGALAVGTVTKVKKGGLTVRLRDSRIGELSRLQCYDYADEAAAQWGEDTSGDDGRLAVGAEVEVLVLQAANGNNRLSLTLFDFETCFTCSTCRAGIDILEIW